MTIPVQALRTLRPRSMGRALAYGLMILSIVVVFLTYVRAPIVALVIGFLAYQFFGILYGKKSFIKSTATISAIAIVIAVAALFLGKTHYMSRWTEMGSKYAEGKIEKLGSGRVGGLIGFYDFYVYKATVFQKIFGSGLGSSYVYLGNKKYIHNDFAEILMGCGVVGFTLYMLIMLKLFLMLRRLLKANRPRGMLDYGLLAMASFFILLAFHMTNVTSGVFIISVWSLFTGATIGMTRRLESKQTLPQPRPVYS
jgi:O-antigen ligase